MKTKIFSNTLPYSKLCFYLLLTGLSYTLLSCEKRSPDIVADNMFGNWKWIKTYDANDNVIEESSPILTKSLKVENTDLNGQIVQAFRFYTNTIQTDSLFMYRGPGNPITDKYTLYVKTVNSEGNNALIRATQYYQKNEHRANRIILNIQRDTDIYKASSDTIRMEYIIVDVP